MWQWRTERIVVYTQPSEHLLSIWNLFWVVRFGCWTETEQIKNISPWNIKNQNAKMLYIHGIVYEKWFNVIFDNIITVAKAKAYKSNKLVVLLKF